MASVEVFPQELWQLSIPDWRVLLIFAYDGPSTMYNVKKKYGFKYPPVHRSTRNLEKLQWLKVIRTGHSKKGTKTKIYGLTLVGLLHLLYRIPRGFRSFRSAEKKFLPEEVETDLRKLHTRRDVALYLLCCFDFEKVAEKNQKLLPLIFGKWNHLKKNDVTVDVFSQIIETAHVTLGDYYGPTTGRRASLHRLFAYKVYYNLLKKSMFEHYPRKREGYAEFDYIDLIHQRTIAIFRDDPQLTTLFKQICSEFETEIISLSKAIQKIKTGVLSQ